MFNLKDWEKLGKKHTEITKKCIQWIKSNKYKHISYFELSSFIYEQITKHKVKKAFPVGISKNHIGAHDTTLLDDTRTFDPLTDYVCIDFGIHEKGYIIDSAFTWNPRFIYGLSDTIYNHNISSQTIENYNLCVDVSKEAVKHMTKLCRPNMLIYDIAQEVQEIIESHDTIYGIPELTGHTIERWNIHGKKLIPSSTKINSFFESNPRIEENDVCALEVYITDSNKKVFMDNINKTNHFNFINPNKQLPCFITEITKNIISSLQLNNSLRLPFSQHYLQSYTNTQWNYMINECYANKIITLYPPVMVKEGHIITQTEDMVYVGNNKNYLLTEKQFLKY
jgi:methionyl aminopeptidase